MALPEPACSEVAMRIAGFDEGGDRRHGLVIDDQLHPLLLGIDLFAALDDIPNQDRSWPRARQQPLSQVRLLAPVLPLTVRDFVTFEEHVEGVRRSVDNKRGVPDQWYAAPTFYLATRTRFSDRRRCPGATVGHGRSTSSWKSAPSSGDWSIRRQRMPVT